MEFHSLKLYHYICTERKKERKKEELFEPRKDIPVCLASSPHVAKLMLTPTMEVDP